MLVGEIIKFLGTLLAAGTAISAVFLEDLKSRDSQKLTTKGKFLVWLAVAGLGMAAAAQVAQISEVLDSAALVRQRHEEIIKRNEDVAKKLETFPELIERSQFPLEPIEMHFRIVYPMKSIHLASYSQRLRKDIVSYLKRSREDRKPTADDLKGENVLFIITNLKDWLPQEDEENEKIAAQILLRDSSAFDFCKPDEQPDFCLRLLSADSSHEGVFVTTRRLGQVAQTITAYADFDKECFIKEVRVVHPFRTGKNISCISSLDLVGRSLKWKFETWIPEAKLARFAMRFSYDLGFAHNTDIPSTRDVDLSGDVAQISRTNIGLTSTSKP